MIDNKNKASKNLEKALQTLEQAKQRVANEKKKQNEKVYPFCTFKKSGLSVNSGRC